MSRVHGFMPRLSHSTRSSESWSAPIRATQVLRIPEDMAWRITKAAPRVRGPKVKVVARAFTGGRETTLSGIAREGRLPSTRIRRVAVRTALRGAFRP